MNTVSAIVTTYRRPETLLRAIRSIINQRSTPNEIVVVDNAGERTTEEVVSFSSNETRIPIRYIVENKRGASAARNRGIKLAASDYVAFLDDDDVWLPSHIEQFHRICAYRENKPILFGGWLARFGKPERLIIPESNKLFKDYVRNVKEEIIVRTQAPLIRPFFTPSMSTSIIERQEAGKVLFDEELVGREDIYFVWQLAQRGDVVLHEQVHALADQLDSSLFSVSKHASTEEELTMNMKKAFYGVKMLEKCCAGLEGRPPVEMKRELGSAYFDFSYVNALSGNLRPAAKFLLKSMRIRLERRHLKLALRVPLCHFVRARKRGS